MDNIDAQNFVAETMFNALDRAKARGDMLNIDILNQDAVTAIRCGASSQSHLPNPFSAQSDQDQRQEQDGTPCLGIRS